MKKFTEILLKIFSIGIISVLIAGALSLLGYIVAICIGGEIATNICSFIYKQYIPWVIRFTSIFAGIGLLAMYLTKTKALTVNIDNKEATDTSEQAKSEENDKKTTTQTKQEELSTNEDKTTHTDENKSN